jgi:hypothetical protein
MTQEQLEQVILQNQASIAKIETTVIKIKKKLFLQELAGYLKLILIVGPIIIALFYVSPYLKQYGSLMSNALSGLNLTSGLDATDLSQKDSLSATDITKVLCDPTARQSLVERMCK